MTTSSDEIPTVTPVVLEYEDLVAFGQTKVDNDDDSSLRDTLIDKIGQAFGPDGLGLLGVANVPDFSPKREALLRLAQKLPTLPDLDTCELPETGYSTGWSHGREQLAPDKPDTAKGSFYANPAVDSLVDYLIEKQADNGRDASYWHQQRKDCPAFYADNVWPASLPALRPAFRDLGQCLMHVGGLVARVCDAYCAQQGVTTAFEDTLTTSKNAKGRLLHYFDMTPIDNEKKQSESNDSADDMWCGWHNDHVCVDRGCRGNNLLEARFLF